MMPLFEFMILWFILFILELIGSFCRHYIIFVATIVTMQPIVCHQEWVLQPFLLRK